MRLQTNDFEGGAAALSEENEVLLRKAVINAKTIANESFNEAEATDSVKSFPAETLRKIKESDLLIAPLPKEYGGIGLGTENGTNAALLRILKHFGRGNLVVGRIYEGHFNALLLIKLFGSNEQMKIFAKDANDGRLFGVWNTEAADGVKIHPLAGDKFRLEGSKTFATGVDYVTRPIVNGALPDGGWQISVVPLDVTNAKIDSSWWNPMGMRATRSFKVDFSGIRLDKQNIIGDAGLYYQQPWFSGGAIRFAAVQFGAAEAIFDETRNYLRMLSRTDDPYQKMRIGEMACLIETGNLWLDSAAAKLDEYMIDGSQEKSENFLAYVNLMRTQIEKICVEIMNLCQKSVGARGLNKPFHFERIIRDLTIYLRQPAPDAALADAGSYVLQSDAPGDEIWKRITEEN